MTAVLPVPNVPMALYIVLAVPEDVIFSFFLLKITVVDPWSTSTLVLILTSKASCVRR